MFALALAKVYGVPVGGGMLAYSRVRVYIGEDANGKPINAQISGKNQNEINDKIVNTNTVTSVANRYGLTG